MKLFYTPTLLIAISLTMTACNENSHDRRVTTSTVKAKTFVSLSGVVIADSYLQGATVCLDTNSNILCDTTEPQTVTNAQGQYTLKHVATEDSARYGVIAVVPAGAIDHNETNDSIAQPYTLTTPIGKHSVISPLTTFVAEEMRGHGDMDINSASEIINYQLKISKIDLFKDYRKDTTNIGSHLRLTALKSSSAFAKSKMAITENITPSDYSALVVHTTAVLDHLSKLFLDISTVINYPEFYKNYISSIQPAAIKSELAFNSLKYTSVSKDNLLNESALFSFNCITHVTCRLGRDNAFEYSQLHFDNSSGNTDVTDDIQRYNPTTNIVSSITSNTIYVPSATAGWMPSNKTAIFDNNKEKTLIYKIDVSNLPIQALTDHLRNPINNQLYFSSSFNIGADKKFPANTYVYKIIRIRLIDDYYHTDLERDIFTDDSAVTTISALKNHALNNDQQFHSNLFGLTIILNPEKTRLNFDFDVKLRPDHSVALVNIRQQTLNFDTSAETTTTTEIDENSGFWEEKTFGTAKLLAVKVDSLKPTNTLKDYRFYTEFNSKLVRGYLEAAGYVREDMLFTQAAMDAIKVVVMPKAL